MFAAPAPPPLGREKRMVPPGIAFPLTVTFPFTLPLEAHPALRRKTAARIAGSRRRTESMERILECLVVTRRERAGGGGAPDRSRRVPGIVSYREGRVTSRSKELR